MSCSMKGDMRNVPWQLTSVSKSDRGDSSMGTGVPRYGSPGYRDPENLR